MKESVEQLSRLPADIRKKARIMKTNRAALALFPADIRKKARIMKTNRAALALFPADIRKKARIAEALKRRQRDVQRKSPAVGLSGPTAKANPAARDPRRTQK